MILVRFLHCSFEQIGILRFETSESHGCGEILQHIHQGLPNCAKQAHLGIPNHTNQLSARFIPLVQNGGGGKRRRERGREGGRA